MVSNFPGPYHLDNVPMFRNTDMSSKNEVYTGRGSERPSFNVIRKTVNNLALGDP